jgi:hypothetical protein
MYIGEPEALVNKSTNYLAPSERTSVKQSLLDYGVRGCF